MTIQTIATISKSFKAFLQGGAYEPAILELMNKSKRVFPLTYELRKEQSHGEPDFIGFTMAKTTLSNLTQNFHLIKKRANSYVVANQILQHGSNLCLRK